MVLSFLCQHLTTSWSSSTYEFTSAELSSIVPMTEILNTKESQKHSLATQMLVSVTIQGNLTLTLGVTRQLDFESWNVASISR